MAWVVGSSWTPGVWVPSTSRKCSHYGVTTRVKQATKQRPWDARRPWSGARVRNTNCAKLSDTARFEQIPRLPDERSPTTESLEDELRDLIESGVLSVLKRRPDYAERREDGYIEPTEIYLVGTNHMSLQSSKDVQRVIETVNPDACVVEVCRSRAGMLYDLEGFEESQDNHVLWKNVLGISSERGTALSALWRSARLGGIWSSLLRVGLVALAVSAGGDESTVYGRDFRAARIAAEKVGASLVLGDRPIEITLIRAWRTMTWSEKRKFFQYVLRAVSRNQDTNSRKHAEMQHRSDTHQSSLQSDLGKHEKLDHMVENWSSVLEQEFPALYECVVAERDLYLLWSLKRSKAVCNANRIVGVVGRGHVSGIKYHFVRDAGNADLGSGSRLRFKDLVDRMDSPLYISILRRVTMDTLAGILLWYLVQTFRS